MVSAWLPLITLGLLGQITEGQQQGDLRFAGFESTRLMGRLEIFSGLSWFPICNDGFGFEEAAVACRQLGLGYPVALFNADASSGPDSVLGRFGFEDVGFYLDDVNCKGIEEHILNCQWRTLHNCGSNEAIGIQCSEYCPQPYSGQVRLVGGAYSSEGIVEVYFNGQWGVVCDSGFNQNAASAVCVQLGYSRAAFTIGDTSYGSPSSTAWVISASCSGSERCLSSCLSSAPSTSGSCPANGFATVKCGFSVQLAPFDRKEECQLSSTEKEGQLRLVDGDSPNTGKLQIYLNNDWGDFCGSVERYNKESLDVICRQLGYRAAESSESGSPGDSVSVAGAECEGVEKRLLECNVTRSTSCSASRSLFITCSISTTAPMLGSVTLSGGGGGAGIVFVGRNGGLGPVCDQDWDLVDGRVACRQMGYGGVFAVSGGSYYGPSSTSPSITHIDCEGSKTHLLSCDHRNDASQSCDQSTLAGLHCNPDVSDTHRGDLRLSNGTSSSGVLEMWLDGEWQAICSTAFSIAAANISCRQLGFSAGAMAFYTDGRFRQVQSGGIIATWCTGNERNLFSCNYSPLASRVCGFDVAIACAENCTKECQNGGTLDESGCVCQCAEGYTGPLCEDCDVECQNGGRVRPDCTCQCLHGFTGELCEGELFCAPEPPTPPEPITTTITATVTTTEACPEPATVTTTASSVCPDTTTFSPATTSACPTATPIVIDRFPTPSAIYNRRNGTIDIVHYPPNGSSCRCVFEKNVKKKPCLPKDTISAQLERNGKGTLVIKCSFRKHQSRLILTVKY